MKKLLLAFAILGFVACGGNEETKTPESGTTTEGTTTAPAEGSTTTETPATPKVDTIKFVKDGKDSAYIYKKADGTDSLVLATK